MTYSRQNYLTWYAKHKTTPKYKAQSLWSSLCKRAENKCGHSPEYSNIKVLMSREEFISWATPRIEEWIKTKPLGELSLDRKDSSGHYELSNLQFITKIENTLKRECNKNVYAPKGFAWCGHCKDYLPVSRFGTLKHAYNGLRSICKSCRSIYQSGANR